MLTTVAQVLAIVALVIAIVYHSIGIYRHYHWFQKRKRKAAKSDGE